MTLPELSPQYNWCDRWCERCPLAAACPIATAPDRPFEDILADACALLEKTCREEGLSLDVPPPPLPSIDCELLHGAARDWTVAARTILPGDARLLLVAGKVARVAAEEEFDDDLVRDADTIPNLILLERTLADVAADIERARPRALAAVLERFDGCDRILRGLLAPLFALITPVDRAILAALAAEGLAPSPWCRLGG